MDKLQKMSRVINTILSVLLVVLIFVSLYHIYFTGVTAFSDFEPGSTGISGLTIGYLELRLNEYVYPEGYQRVFQLSLIANIMTAVFGIYVILKLKRIFNPMSRGLPFQSSVSKAMTRLAWAVLVYGIASVLLEFGLYTVMYQTLDLGHLLLNDIVEAVNLKIVANGDFVVWSVILFLLSHVFRYGEQLQQLSDETL